MAQDGAAGLAHDVEVRKMEKQKTKTLDMTQGSLWKNIFLFSMPLVLAQLLEVMFNLSDVAGVGRL